MISPFTACLMLPLGGAFARVPRLGARRSATAARSGTTTCSRSGRIPRRRSANVEWTRNFDSTMAEFAEAGVYVNFVGDPSASAVEAGFGADKYARLVEVKRAYDPDNVFRSNTNIPPD